MSDIQKTVDQRGSRYGSMERNAILTQSLMDCINMYENNLSAVHLECVHMIFHKISRMTVGDPMYADNAHDIAGYATLLEQYINEQNNG